MGVENISNVNWDHVKNTDIRNFTIVKALNLI